MINDKQVNVDYSETLGLITITAENSRLLLNPSLRLFFNKHKAEKTDSSVSIKAKSADISNIYKQLKKILSDADSEIVESANFAFEIADIKKKEIEFELFSKKTLAVWQRELIPDELHEFKSVVASQINRELSRLQFLSALHLAISQNACNFSVPGAGKTTIVYSAYSYLNSLAKENIKHIDRLLVIGPLASYIAWQKEFEMCFKRLPKSIRIISGMKSHERKNILSGIDPSYRDIELIHTSFQTAVNYENEIANFLQHPAKKTMLVIDEAHNIKREDGVWANTCLRLASYASSRVILTGTPAPNGYEDLYNLFKFLYPERNLVGFPRPNLIAMSENKMPSEAMRSRIRPFFTRITKNDLRLPPFKENPVIIEMSEKERQIYSFVEDVIVPDLSRDEEDEIKPFQRANLIRLRQSASNPEMLLKPLEDEFNNELFVDAGISMKDSEIYEKINKFRFKSDSSKYQFLSQLCKDRVAKGQKILIWSYFISTLDSLEKYLKEDLGINIWRISGQTPSEGNSESDDNEITREKIIKSFIDDPTQQILIANPQALGESVSLHYSCHIAVYFDRDFNCGRFIQSKDRIHRYGLPDDVLTEYFYLGYKNTIDEDVSSRLITKERRMNDILERDEIPLFREMDDGAGDVDDIVSVLRSYAARKLQ